MNGFSLTRVRFNQRVYHYYTRHKDSALAKALEGLEPKQKEARAIKDAAIDLAMEKVAVHGRRKWRRRWHTTDRNT